MTRELWQIGGQRSQLCRMKCLRDAGAANPLNLPAYEVTLGKKERGPVLETALLKKPEEEKGETFVRLLLCKETY